MPAFPYWLLLLTLLLPLPFGTTSPTARRGRAIPWVTYALIGVNVVIYVFTYFFTGPAAYDRWGLTPDAPRFSALLTYLFLHVSLAHLFWNMVFLWLFGPQVEEALGRTAFCALYFGGGIAAGLLHMAIILVRGEIVSVPLIGASGAISAILAPFVLRFHRAQIRMVWLPGVLLGRDWGLLEVPALAGVGVWLVQNIGGGLLFLRNPQPGGTAYWAHIGGFAFGLVAAELTGLLRDGRQDYLLQDARAAAARGHEALALAARKYRAYLDRDPDNAAVRAELGCLLAERADDPDGGRADAAREMEGAIRLFLKREEAEAGARVAAQAGSLGLPLTLTPRERLRLAGSAESAGDLGTAITLLQALVGETPDAPEDEMARLKLGQLLRGDDPEAARTALAGFLSKYPQSEWVARARALSAELQTNV